jgi:hypothetical protein
MGMDPWTAELIGFGASTIMGGDQQEKVNKKEKQRLAAFNKIYAGLNPEVRGLYDKALRGIETGYADAAGKLSGAGATAKFDAGVSSKQNVAAQTDSAIGRGLYGTSLVNSIQRGGASDLSRTKSAIDEQTASMLSGLMTGKAHAQASLFGQEAGAISNLGMSQGSGLMSQQFQVGKSPSAFDISSLLGGKGT